MGIETQLSADIKKYCYTDMLRFLEHSSAVFPNAVFVVIGYFPILSPNTDTGKMLNAFLEVYNLPRPLKFSVNNILIKQFFKPVKEKALKRSRIWFAESNTALEASVNRVNEIFVKQRAIFVKALFREDDAIDTPKTQLFQMIRNGRINDDAYEIRSKECQQVLTKLRKEIGLKQSIKQCQSAAIGHPNPTGSRLYADAITAKLKSLVLPDKKMIDIPHQKMLSFQMDNYSQLSLKLLSLKIPALILHKSVCEILTYFSRG